MRPLHTLNNLLKLKNFFFTPPDFNILLGTPTRDTFRDTYFDSNLI